MDTNKIGSGEIVYPRTISPEPQILRFAELHVEDSAMGQVKWRSMDYGCKQGATLKCIKTKKELQVKLVTLFALQDGLEPTTP